jgi:formylmethanofuran dehydrogenase subunit E
VLVLQPDEALVSRHGGRLIPLAKGTFDMRRAEGKSRKGKIMLDRELLSLGIRFHGHKCPAMPMGLRAGLAAMQALGVARAQDKELHAISETGEGHAAGCFVDGIMTATGCTFGKGNIEKRRYHKMAFTLIDVRRQKAVRVSLKPEFFAAALDGPFVSRRKAGVLPQDIDPGITDPIVEKIASLPEEQFLRIGPVVDHPFPKRKGIFEARPCGVCGELTFVDKLRVTEDGKPVCIPCSGYA